MLSFTFRRGDKSRFRLRFRLWLFLCLWHFDLILIWEIYGAHEQEQGDRIERGKRATRAGNAEGRKQGTRAGVARSGQDRTRARQADGLLWRRPALRCVAIGMRVREVEGCFDATLARDSC
jgi:hypothetical protein